MKADQGCAVPSSIVVLFFRRGTLRSISPPADLPKSGGRLDLAIALGILAAAKQIKTDRAGPI